MKLFKTTLLSLSLFASTVTFAQEEATTEVAAEEEPTFSHFWIYRYLL